MKRLILLLILSASAAIPSRPSRSVGKVWTAFKAVVNDRAYSPASWTCKFLFLRVEKTSQVKNSFEKSGPGQFIEDALVARQPMSLPSCER
jgi:hypothetical protein